jgi:hypothetical protein
MSRTALVKLLIAQTLLLVLVAWAGVFFARDEFLLATATDDDEAIPTSASPTADPEAGVPTVTLSAAAQHAVGIETAPPQPVRLAGETEWPATVLAVQPLVELQGRLQAARHDADAARLTAAASAAEARRVQALYDDDRNASQRSLEAAVALARVDAAREAAAQAALTALGDQARAGWGPTIAAWLQAADGAVLQDLVKGRAALLRVPVPADATPTAGAPRQLTLSGAVRPTAAGASTGLRAQPLGPAPAADAPGAGRSLLYRAPVGGLAAGMRLSLTGSDGAVRSGVLVPASALVWHLGQPWVYVKESDPPEAGQAFQRRAVPGARRHGDAWFLPGFEEDDPVVVRGAQVLLSEELKYQIRNENDD